MKEDNEKPKHDFAWMENDRNLWRALAILFLIGFIVMILLQMYGNDLGSIFSDNTAATAAAAAASLIGG
jgi:Na+-driven multidrug efflux pump